MKLNESIDLSQFNKKQSQIDFIKQEQIDRVDPKIFNESVVEFDSSRAIPSQNSIDSIFLKTQYLYFKDQKETPVDSEIRMSQLENASKEHNSNLQKIWDETQLLKKEMEKNKKEINDLKQSHLLEIEQLKQQLEFEKTQRKLD